MENRKKSGLFAEERKREIVSLLKKDGKIVVPELCLYFGVSASTIRNDLRELQDSGVIQRTHGGAIFGSKAGFEPPPEMKIGQMMAQKRAIALAAVQLVENDDVIAIGTGTTTMEFARELVSKKHLTVVVNDIRIANFLEEKTDWSVFMLGGMIRRGFHYVNTSGLPLPNINVDKMFFSCNALSVAMGATVPDFQLAAGVRSISKLASELILLCDSSKIGASTFAQIAALNEIDTIVVDSDVSKDDLEELQQNGRNVVVALNPSAEE